MIALFYRRDKCAETLSIGLSWRFLPKTVLEVWKEVLTLGTWPSNLVFASCLTQLPNLRKIGENRGRYRRRNVCADRQTDRPTGIHYSDYISVQWHE